MFLFTDPKEVSDDAVFLLFPMAETFCIQVCLRRRCTHTHGSPRRLWWWLHLMIPAPVTIFLFQFVAIWNNYFLPLVMLSDEKLFPITVGLKTWNVTTAGATKFLYGLIITGALISSIPLLAGCVVLQRFWRGRLGTGSVKG